MRHCFFGANVLRRSTHGIVLVLVGSVVPACTDSPQTFSHEPLNLAAHEVEDGRLVLELTHSPQDVADGRVPARTLTTARRILTVSMESMGRLSDVRFYGDVDLILADRMVREILILDPLNESSKVISRAGDGPGEISDVVGLVPVGENVVVWAAIPGRSFQVLTSEGLEVARPAKRVDGDWEWMVFRKPATWWDVYQAGPEHMSARLLRVDHRHFAHVVQDDERFSDLQPREDEEVPGLWTTLILYNDAAEVVDTLARLPAPTTIGSAGAPGSYGYYWQPLFSGRPWFALTPEWLAVAHGDSTTVSVQNWKNSTVAYEISWKSTSRPIDDADRQGTVDLLLQLALIDDPEFRRMWEGMDRRARARNTDDVMTNALRFASVTPELSSLWAAGSCIFLSGFRSSETLFGESPRIMAVNLEHLEVEAIELPLHGFRIRDVDHERFLITTRTSDGGWSIEIVEHGVDC